MVSNAEWEVLRVIWTLGNAGSSEIIDILNLKKQWSSSTVKTLISRLVEKKLISYKKISNKNIYYSNFTEKEILTEAISELLNKICSKKVPNVLELIIDNTDISKKDIEKLENILKSKKINAPDNIKCNCIVGQCICKL